jgi:hypothetical protein
MNRGGARKGAGRKPGPGGTKIDKNVALTADVWAFLVASGNTAGEAIEQRVRKSAAFKAWMKDRGNG